MKLKKLLILLPLSLFILPILSVVAQDEPFTFQDRINMSNSAFFMTPLDVGDQIDIFITAGDKGEYLLFLFDERPIQTYVELDRSINPEIYDKALMFDGPASAVSLTYTAVESKIHYFQLILVENGPDFYYLVCNKELTRYYLPMIPGYSIEFVLLSLMISIGVAVYIIRKKVVKI